MSWYDILGNSCQSDMKDFLTIVIPIIFHSVSCLKQETEWKIKSWSERLHYNCHYLHETLWRLSSFYCRLLDVAHPDMSDFLTTAIVIQEISWELLSWYKKLLHNCRPDMRYLMITVILIRNTYWQPETCFRVFKTTVI